MQLEKDLNASKQLLTAGMSSPGWTAVFRRRTTSLTEIGVMVYRKGKMCTAGLLSRDVRPREENSKQVI